MVCFLIDFKPTGDESLLIFWLLSHHKYVYYPMIIVINYLPSPSLPPSHWSFTSVLPIWTHSTTSWHWTSLSPVVLWIALHVGIVFKIFIALLLWTTGYTLPQLKKCIPLFIKTGNNDPPPPNGTWLSCYWLTGSDNWCGPPGLDRTRLPSTLCSISTLYPLHEVFWLFCSKILPTRLSPSRNRGVVANNWRYYVFPASIL